MCKVAVYTAKEAIRYAAGLKQTPDGKAWCFIYHPS